MPSRKLQCQRCTTPFEAMRSDAKWCESCKKLVHKDIERKFEARRRHSCVDCGVQVARKSVRCKACTYKHWVTSGAHKGEKQWNWKGGVHTDQWGYKHLLVHPERKKGHRYRPEHRLVWEAANGPIPKGHVVHHINGVKDDNRLENLEVMPRKKHNHRHDDHDRRILELEDEVHRLKEQL